MSKIEEYRRIKECFNLEYKGIKLNKVLTSYLMYRVDQGKRFPLKGLAYFLLKLDTPVFEQSRGKSGLFAMFGLHTCRNDHRTLLKDVAGKVDRNVCFIDASYSKSKFSFNVMHILNSIVFVLKNIHNTNLSFIDKILLAAKCTYWCNTIDSIEKYDFSKFKKYVCLANSLDLDNLMTQYLANKGVVTYSLMEGAYFRQIGDKSIFEIFFENLTSDYQLCWGQYSKDEFIARGFHPDRMIVAGYPKNVVINQMKTDNRLSEGVVLLSTTFYDEQNLKLLKVLSALANDFDISLKLHPALDYQKYKTLADEYGFKVIDKSLTVNDCIDNTRFDFAIVLNSSTYYEALMRGIPCFRFCDGSFSLMSGYDDVFSNVTEFKDVVKRIISMEIKQYQKDIDKVLEYSIGLGIDNYSEILHC